MPLKTPPAKKANKSQGPAPMTPPNSRLSFYSGSSASTPHTVSDTFTPGRVSCASSLPMGDDSKGNRIVDFQVQDGHSTVGSFAPGGLQNKRHPTESPQEPSSKRSRKPSRKAKQIFIDDEVEE